METWMIAAALATTGLALLVSITCAAATCLFLWRRFVGGAVRGVGTVYPPSRQVAPPAWPAHRRTAASRSPPRPPVPQPPRPMFVSQLADEDRTKTVVFSRYNATDEVDTEDDEGSERKRWEVGDDDGRANISLEDDITPAPAPSRQALSADTPHDPKNSFPGLFRKR